MVYLWHSQGDHGMVAEVIRAEDAATEEIMV
jgi:hypothetical protein